MRNILYVLLACVALFAILSLFVGFPLAWAFVVVLAAFSGLGLVAGGYPTSRPKQ